MRDNFDQTMHVSHMLDWQKSGREGCMDIRVMDKCEKDEKISRLKFADPAGPSTSMEHHPP
jgi:hypothetical protein